MGASQSKERPQLHVPSSGDEPFSVVGCRRIRFPDGPAAQVFFPAREIDDAEAARKAQKAYPYMRREAFNGLVSWLRKPMFVMKTFGIHLWHTPCSPSAHPLSPMDKGKNGVTVPATGLPVMIFSHGLGGHSDLHATLGQLMARKGFVVFALEHECRAGSYARRESGTVLTYDRPQELTKEQKKEGYQLYLKLCQEFRRPFLDHRESEYAQVLECLRKRKARILQSTGDEFSDEDPVRAPEQAQLDKLLSTIDVSRLLLAGHSFGAATAIQIAQSENAALKGAFKACLLYDPWTEPIPDAALQKGIDLPTLTMTSGPFMKVNFAYRTEALMEKEHTPKCCVAEMPGVTHQGWADTPLYFSSGIGKAVEARGKQDPVEAFQFIADASEATFQVAERGVKRFPDDVHELLSMVRTGGSVQPLDPTSTNSTLEDGAEAAE